MPPEQVVATPIYGITKDPRLLESMVTLPILTRQKIDEKITELQFDPRPPESTSMVLGAVSIYRKPIIIDERQQRNYHLVYIVNDEKEKVMVIALEMFSQ